MEPEVISIKSYIRASYGVLESENSQVHYSKQFVKNYILFPNISR